MHSLHEVETFLEIHKHLKTSLEELSLVHDVLVGRDTHPLFDTSTTPMRQHVVTSVETVGAILNQLTDTVKEYIEYNATSFSCQGGDSEHTDTLYIVRFRVKGDLVSQVAVWCSECYRHISAYPEAYKIISKVAI